jgi:tetratricopeptide (TPR) repeat protein
MKALRLAVLVLGLVPAPSLAQEKDIDALMEKAVGLHQGGDLEGAAALYVEVLRAVPGASRVRSNLGAAYAGLGRYDEAIAEYRKALDVEEDPSVRQNLALSLLKTGRLEEAAEEAARVLQAQAGNRNMILVTADCRLRLGQDEKVVELLKPVAEADPESKAVAYMLGTALLNLGRTEEAQVVMDRVFRDDSPEARLLLGAMQARRGDTAAAVALYEKALAANPRIPLAHFLLGQSLLEKSDWEGAAAAFRQEVEIDPNHFESNLMLGNLLRKEGRHDEALRYLTHASRLKGNDLAVRFALGATYVAMGRAEDGVPLLEEVEKAIPDHLPTRMYLAQAYVKLGRGADATRERAAAVRLQQEADARSFEGARDRLDDVLGRPRPSAPSPAKPPGEPAP